MVVAGAPVVVVVVVTRVGDVGRGSVVLEAGGIVVGVGEVIIVGARDEAVSVGAGDDDGNGDAVVVPDRVVVGVEASFPPEHAAPTSATATNPIKKRPITSAALRGARVIPRPIV